MKDCLLIVLLKAPVPGLVKTRIARDVGERRAMEIYRSLLDELFGNLSQLSSVRLCHAPPDQGERLDPWMQAGWDRTPQAGGDLGARMRAAFQQAFDAGYRKVLLIGSDCPGVRQTDIETGWHALEEVEVVLGPSRDGGYWLIGLQRPVPELFENMTWSTSKVLEETLRRIELMKLKPVLLETKTDVDTEADWIEHQLKPGRTF